eukprot:scaffold6652_cov113-Cylindrotheca_fusiformis.AAC.1
MAGREKWPDSHLSTSNSYSIGEVREWRFMTCPRPIWVQFAARRKVSVRAATALDVINQMAP